MMLMPKRKTPRQWQAMNPRSRRWVRGVMWTESTGPRIRWTKNPHHAQLFTKDRILSLRETLQHAGCVPVLFQG